MDAEYTISEDDYVNAMKLYSRFTPRLALIYGIGFLVLLLFAVFGSPTLKSGGGIVTVLGRFLISPILARRHYKKYKAIHLPIHIGLKDEGVGFSTSDGGGVVRWENIYKWRQNDRYLLIYPMPRLYHIIPKSIESSGFDISALVAMLQAKVGKET